MERLSKKRTISVIAVLVFILALCAWLFGWGRGDINVLEFSAGEVERIELSCTDTKRVDLYRAVVTEKDDIQALINSVNSLQHTGSGVKELFKYGIGSGGTILYEYSVYLSNGDTFTLCIASLGTVQDLSDMEATYWVDDQPDKTKWISDTCRGSMEFFYELYEKYPAAE